MESVRDGKWEIITEASKLVRGNMFKKWSALHWVWFCAISGGLAFVWTMVYPLVEQTSLKYKIFIWQTNMYTLICVFCSGLIVIILQWIITKIVRRIKIFIQKQHTTT